MFESPKPPAEKGPSEAWCKTYVTSVTGILKIVEMVLSIITFGCCVSINHGAYGWASFVTITGFIHSTVSFIVHIINYFPDTMLGYTIELIVYAVYTLLFFITAIILAVFAGRFVYFGQLGAAAFFCWASLIAWIIDTVLQFIEWNNRRREPTASGPTTTTTPAEDSSNAQPTY